MPLVLDQGIKAQKAFSHMGMAFILVIRGNMYRIGETNTGDAGILAKLSGKGSERGMDPYEGDHRRTI